MNASAAKRPECVVDARLMYLQSLGQGVVKIALHIFHYQEVAVTETDHPFLLGLALPDGEVPPRSKRNAGDARRVNFGFVVAVPPHGVYPVSVQVEEAGIENGGSITKFLHRIAQLQHLRRELPFRPTDSRIGVGRPHPCGQPGFQVFFAIDGNGVMLPGNVCMPIIERFVGKRSADYPTSSTSLTQDGFLT